MMLRYIGQTDTMKEGVGVLLDKDSCYVVILT